MTLTINTNMGSIVVQKNLSDATDALNKSLERLTTGYKINSAADDPAGFAVATKMETQLSSISVVQDNVALGSSLLSTAESNYDLITDHLQRIRDLTEQAANGTYSTDSEAAIKTEILSRLDEIDRLTASAEFNGIYLLNGSQTTGINIQAGITSGAESQIALEASMFADTHASTILNYAGQGNESFAAACSSKSTAVSKLDTIDNALKNITTRETKIGASQNRLDSAAEALDVQYTNVTSSLSTIKDADIAAESSEYIKAQILQQASATLLATANQAPSIALNLM